MTLTRIAIERRGWPLVIGVFRGFGPAKGHQVQKIWIPAGGEWNTCCQHSRSFAGMYPEPFFIRSTSTFGISIITPYPYSPSLIRDLLQLSPHSSLWSTTLNIMELRETQTLLHGTIIVLQSTPCPYSPSHIRALLRMSLHSSHWSTNTTTQTLRYRVFQTAIYGETRPCTEKQF